MGPLGLVAQGDVLHHARAHRFVTPEPFVVVAADDEAGSEGAGRTAPPPRRERPRPHHAHDVGHPRQPLIGPLGVVVGLDAEQTAPAAVLGGQAHQATRRHLDIGVEEHDDGGTGGGGPGGTRPRLAVPPRRQRRGSDEPHPGRRPPGGHLGGAVVGMIVDHHDLRRGRSLGGERVQQDGQRGCLVAGRHDDGHRWVAAIRVSRARPWDPPQQPGAGQPAHHFDDQRRRHPVPTLAPCAAYPDAPPTQLGRCAGPPGADRPHSGPVGYRASTQERSCSTSLTLSGARGRTFRQVTPASSKAASRSLM